MEEHQVGDQSSPMELFVLQFYWTLVHLRVSGLRTEGLPAMQPEGAFIAGEALGGSEVCFDQDNAKL